METGAPENTGVWAGEATGLILMRLHSHAWAALWYASVLLLTSPSFLYFARFNRHDVYSAFFTLLFFCAVVRFVAAPRPLWAFVGAAAWGLMFTNKEDVFIITAIFGVGLAVAMLWQAARDMEQGKADAWRVAYQGVAELGIFGVALPEEPEAREFLPMPACVTDPIRDLDLARAGVTSIIWATGYGADYRWLNVDALDDKGRPRHQRGVSSEPGVYFLGLPWQTRRGSSFIWGVWYDAKYIADHIAKQRGYLAYAPSPQREIANV